MHPSGVRWSRRPTFIFTCLFLLFAVSYPVASSRVQSFKRANLTSTAITTPASSSSGSGGGVQSSSHSNHHQPRHLNSTSRHSSSSSSTTTFLTTVTSYVDTPSGLEVDQQEIVSLLTGEDEDERDLAEDFGDVATSAGSVTSVVNTSNNNNGRRRGGGKQHGQQRSSTLLLDDEELEDDSLLSTTNSNSNNNNSNGRRHKHNQQQLQQKSLNHNNYHSQNHQTHHHYHSNSNNNNNNYNSNNNNNRNSYHNSYGVSNCSRCRMLEETINVTKEAIKLQILSKLGLKVAPNITKRALPRIPPLDHLLDMYNMQGDSPVAHNAFKPGPVYEEAEDDYHAKMQKIISFAQEPPVSWQLPSNMAIQYFKFSHAVMVNKAVRANLWVYLTPSRQLPDPYIWLHVYKVWRSELNLSHVLQDHAVSAKVNIKPRKGMWYSVDIRKTVGEWFRYPHLNMGLVVQAFDNEGRQLVATDRLPGVDTSQLPFMEVFVMDESKRRTKRMIGLNCEEGSPEVRCCRYPLKVDFEEFGWDWIIAPKSYEANYCSGECPFVFLQKYPHTHLVQQANPSGSAGPCCAPRKMSPISMLYFDHELNIIYGLLPGMVVDRCGCS